MSTLTPLFYRLLARYDDRGERGAVSTSVADVEFFWARRTLPRAPLVYKPSIVIVGQGHKVGYLGPRQFRYDPSTFLVVGVPMPFECESHGTADAPLLGLRVNIEPLALHALVAKVGEPLGFDEDAGGPHAGLEPVPLDDGLRRAAARLLEAMQDPLDSKVLGPAARDEVIYRTLRSAKGQVLYDLTQHHTQYAVIARALERMHREYQASMSVDELAEAAGMSVSAFHRAFKKVTGQSPLQYLKKIRLDKALGLLMHQQLPVNVTAYEVGYESPSQFSREFKRHFDVSPSAIRDESTAAAV